MPDISITGPDGTFSAYLAVPQSGSGAGVLMIQEIFGVNQDMRDHCDARAAEGYIALCPDLFWRQKPGIQLTDQSEEEWAQAVALYQALDYAKAVEDLKTSLGYLRNLEGCTGKVGAMGFCLGGYLTYLMATRSDTDCNAGYYGVGIDTRLNEQDQITSPTLLHIAEEDKFVPPPTQALIKEGLAGNAQVIIHSYPGMDHAFARHGGTHFDADAARLANERTAALFRANLG
ncbi:dienelactone hydrolase family protein [Sneathiella marina]|uniref:Dienelactone hydrolase family protein n=1 Tax=Sneathiella marina TaxID=2950108 RepID=A0ABY4W077_9PROT|nr:dienelactone hydrolase family protein [Sneathiella marina]USG60553.1 dienelactone hydrolase family protein [Sneathiella marina]